MDLDDLDLALVEQLGRDGRASYESLGASVGLSRTAARARVQRIFDSGVVWVAAMVDPKLEGINAFGHVSITVDGAGTAGIAATIAKLPEAPFVSIGSGRYAILAELRSSDLAHLAETVGSIRSIDGVELVDTVLYTHMIKEPHAPTRSPGNVAQFDDVDRRLLALLGRDARMPYADLAEHVGLSPGATRTRVKRMIDDGVVTITGMVNPTAFGLTQMCGFEVHLSDYGAAALDEIAALPPVEFLARTLGRCDAVGTIITRTRTETIETLDRVRAITGVRGVQSWMHLELVKERYARPASRLFSPDHNLSAPRE